MIYKEDLDELCGDLHAIRLIAQLSSIPQSVRTPLKEALKEVLRARTSLDNEKVDNHTELRNPQWSDISSTDDTPPKKKIKVNESIENMQETEQPKEKREDPIPSTSKADEPLNAETNITKVDPPKESPKASLDETEQMKTSESEVNGENDIPKDDNDSVDMGVSIKGLSTEETQKCFQRTINNFIRAILGIITSQEDSPSEPSELQETDTPAEPDAQRAEEHLDSSNTSIQSASELIPEHSSTEASPSKNN